MNNDINEVKTPCLKSYQNQGQATIFFIIILMLFLGVMAFVVNVGLFVKAKINLQNAVDAAAFAGASVQARQLTNIAYLNWEMRNVYKEWMFKYYVLGNLNIRDVKEGVSGDSTNFRMESVTNTKDSYNFPSVCIHFGGVNVPNICRTYTIPGVPRFNALSSNNFAIDQLSNEFIDTIVSEKQKNCSIRSEMNFLTANLWAFNVPNNGATEVSALLAAAPELAANRMGAWPKSFELALRIRNLENIVNKAAYRGGVCRNQANASGNCQFEVDSLPVTAGNERINKAFYSAYRNLGNEDDDEMKNSFTITEIPPKSYSAPNASSLSNMLSPKILEKNYLDLKLNLINLTTFYTAFVGDQGETEATIGNQTQTLNVQGQCDATKVGLPVPGYPLGFTKNAEVVTYYAVKGEANFVGLFNPFSNVPIKLTAYAAAKPFGGRIGPHLFKTTDNLVQARNDTAKYRSSSYVSGLDLSQLLDKFGQPIANNTYLPGAPIPLDINDTKFWVSSPAQALGGETGDPQSVVFGIPNLVYTTKDASSTEYIDSNKIQIIRPNPTPGVDDPIAGLYNKYQMNEFRKLLPNIDGIVQPEDIDVAIKKTYGPTAYEVNNYLIPSPEIGVNQQLGINSFGIIPESGANGFYKYQIYAPLFGSTDDLLFNSTESVKKVFENFIIYQKEALKKYIVAMNQVAATIARPPDQDGNLSSSIDELGVKASEVISDIDVMGDLKLAKPSCKSIAGKFAWFYSGDNDLLSDVAGCPKDFPKIFKDYWDNFTQFGGENSQDYYTSEFYLPPDFDSKKLFSAYRPGDKQGGDISGNWGNTLTGSSELMIRNYYSVKFVPLKAVMNDGIISSSQFAIVSEGQNSNAELEDIKLISLKNALDGDSIGISSENLKRINH